MTFHCRNEENGNSDILCSFSRSCLCLLFLCVFLLLFSRFWLFLWYLSKCCSQSPFSYAILLPLFLPSPIFSPFPLLGASCPGHSTYSVIVKERVENSTKYVKLYFISRWFGLRCNSIKVSDKYVSARQNLIHNKFIRKHIKFCRNLFQNYV